MTTHAAEVAPRAGGTVEGPVPAPVAHRGLRGRGVTGPTEHGRTRRPDSAPRGSNGPGAADDRRTKLTLVARQSSQQEQPYGGDQQMVGVQRLVMVWPATPCP